jgi:hypothetical protein
MLDYTNDQIETAFEIIAQDYEHDPGDIQINGWNFNTTVDEDKSLLKLLAKSPVRWKIVELRDMLNEALGKPVLTPEDELTAAAEVFLKHLSSGYLLDTPWMAAISAG